MKHTLPIEPKVKAFLSLVGPCLDFKVHECKEALDFVVCSEDSTVLLYFLQKLGQNCWEQHYWILVLILRKMYPTLEISGNQSKNGESKVAWSFLNKVKTQMGSGQSRKRKHVIKDLDHSRSKQRRIFNKTKGIKGVSAFKVIQPQSMRVYRDIFS